MNVMNESIVMKATPPAFVAFPPPGGFLKLAARTAINGHDSAVSDGY